MMRVLILCIVSSCRRVSGVKKVSCVCVLRASGVMGVGVFVC